MSSEVRESRRERVEEGDVVSEHLRFGTDAAYLDPKCDRRAHYGDSLWTDAPEDPPGQPSQHLGREAQSDVGGRRDNLARNT